MNGGTMFDVKTLIGRMKASARVFQEPFLFVHFSEILSALEYAQILEELASFDPAGRVNYEKKTSGLELYDPPEGGAFSRLKAAVGSDEFSRFIFSYFSAEPFTKFDVTLNRDFSHRSYGPHLDNPPRRLSFQIYLPEGREHEDLGTVFGRMENREFRSVLKLPFLPNSGYAFLSGDETWHSLPIFESLAKPRQSLMYRWKAPL